jgi:hypothetical protein
MFTWFHLTFSLFNTLTHFLQITVLQNLHYTQDSIQFQVNVLKFQLLCKYYYYV